MARLLSLLLVLLLVPATFAQDRADRYDRSVDRLEDIADRLRDLAEDQSASERTRLTRAARLLDRAADELDHRDAEDAEDLIDEAVDLIEDVVEDLKDEGHGTESSRVKRELNRLETEADRVDDLRWDRYAGESFEDRMERFGERMEEWGERFGERWEERGEEWEEKAEDWAEDWEDKWEDRDRKWSRKDWRERRYRFRSYAPAYVGDFGYRWPFQETATYRPISSVRYNRVDGLTLGVRRQPMDWDSYDRARIFGQVSRSFGLDEWRYEIGGEARLGHSYRSQDFDLKVGGAYRLETATDDLWKASWAENTAAAFFFRTDLFDYYQTEGYTLYAQARLTPFLQSTVAYRSDDYKSLSRNASWSLFGGDSFRFNPAIDEGRMQSLVVALDGGRVRGLRWIPHGVAFRAEAEFGETFGGDFDFTRYIGDVRTYLRMGRDMGVALRFRGGTSQGDLPLQKTFTLGGAGSVRAYPQNLFRGSEMLLANAEITFYDVDPLDGILDGVALFGLFDAGWVDGPNNLAFETDDVITAAGVGIALDDRQVRFELAWPLRDLGTGLEPTLWLRFNPTF
ncbi:MAG: BamA/TamA family outer membrane protein [Rhodothermales bacterium]|nr:BamA/TamA family outer membrane protein [Rhodothermales bacterium]